MSRAHRALAAVAVLLMVTGCSGSPSSSAASSSPAPLTLLPSADPFTSAVVATKSLGTARLTVNAVYGDAEVRGGGVTVLGSGQGDVTWTTADDTYRELVNGRGVYVQRPPQTGGWEQWPAGTITATSGYVDSLRGLGVLRDVTAEGTETLGTVQTTRYRGWLPLTEDEARRLGLSGVPDADAREDVTVWIDTFDHAVRVDREAATPTDSVTSSTEFSDFSVLLNLTSPSSDVTATRS